MSRHVDHHKFWEIPPPLLDNPAHISGKYRGNISKGDSLSSDQARNQKRPLSKWPLLIFLNTGGAGFGGNFLTIQ